MKGIRKIINNIDLIFSKLLFFISFDVLMYDGNIIIINIAIITTTASNSVNVNPFFIFFTIIILTYLSLKK